MPSEIGEFFAADSFFEFMRKMIMLLCLPFMWLNVLAVIVAMYVVIFVCWLITIPKSVVEVIRGKKANINEEKKTEDPEDPWYVNCKSPTLP